MRRKIFLYALPISIVIILAFNIYNKQIGDKNKILQQVITHALNMGHFEELSLNEELSERIYKLYLEKLDYSKRYLLQEDIKEFDKYRKTLTKEIQNSQYKFFHISSNRIKDRIKETEHIYQEVLKSPFNFKKDDYLETEPDKLDFPKNKKERYNRWVKIIKYSTMLKLDRMITMQEAAIKSNDTTYVVKSMEELEANARKEVMNDYKDMYRRYSKLNESDWLSTYLNAFTGSYDPHTQYMAPKIRENFDISMSGRLEGIGATLTEQKGYIKVVRIVPGSPSWKQGDLKAEDLILKVAEGDSTAVSVVDMRLDDAVKLIRGKKGTEVKLTVKKPDNSIVVIPIIRDVIIIDEAFAKSAIIQIDGSFERYGYIDLPSFYVDFKHRKTGRFCSDDIAIEIEKLKKEQVDGIILDLRNNGGGSLQDVIKIGGLFIKDGPIVQVKSRKGKAHIYKDKDKRIQYDGNLIILVNTLSASASEILAAAMQDYKRAVIVGAPTTYGKGTVQNIIDLDRMINTSYSSIKPLGSLRLTIQKFYRINGGTTQRKGVIPDIILPDAYNAYDIGEKYLPYALPWDEIEPAYFQKWPLPTINLPDIKKQSAKRVSTNKTFQNIIENTDRLKKEKEKTRISLNLNKFREEQKALSEESKKYKKLITSKTSLNTFILKQDLNEFEALINKSADENEPVDSSKLINRKRWLEDLTKDAYIEEAAFIMRDIK